MKPWWQAGFSECGWKLNPLWIVYVCINILGLFSRVIEKLQTHRPLFFFGEKSMSTSYVEP